MTTEYVRIAGPEKFYTEKNLLQAQLEILSTHTRYKNYKKLRKEELVLRIALRKKISEAKALIKLHLKTLPKMKVLTTKNSKGKAESEVLETEIESLKDRSTLQQEIDDIQRQLERLS